MKGVKAQFQKQWENERRKNLLEKNKYFISYFLKKQIIPLVLLITLIPCALYENKKAKVILTQNNKDIFIHYFLKGNSAFLFAQGDIIVSIPPVIDTKVIIYNDRTISFQCRTENTSYENFPPLFCKINEEDFQSLINRIEKSHLLTLDDKYNFKYWTIVMYEKSPCTIKIYTDTMQKEFRSWGGIDKYALGLQNDMQNLCKKYGLIDLWKEVYFSNY